jgi:hypothetical protein
MLSATKIYLKIRRTNDPEQRAKGGSPVPEHPGTLWRLRKSADCVQGGTTKGTGHDHP